MGAFAVERVVKFGGIFLEDVSLEFFFEEQVLVPEALILVLEVLNKFDELFVFLAGGFAAGGIDGGFGRRFVESLFG